MKTCTKCKHPKDLSQFYKNHRAKDRLHSWCKACCYERQQSEEYKAYHKTPARKLYRKKWGESEVGKAKIRSNNLKNLYNLTIEEYELILSSQNFGCKICQTSGSTLVVDHDHKTGSIRGLLCNNCNAGIGFLKDDPNLCKQASDYLKDNMNVVRSA